MKRPLTLTSIIMSLAMQAITLIMLIVLLIEPSELVASFDGVKKTAIYIFLSIFLACIIFLIVINSLSINIWNKPSSVYQKKEILILCVMLFDFIGVGGAFVLSFFKLRAINLTIIIFEILICLASATLLIIDNALEKKRASKMTNKIEKPIEKQIANKVVSTQNKLQNLLDMKEKGLINDKEYSQFKEELIAKEAPKVAERPKSELELKLEKLLSMKNRGLITQEEYKELKMNYIKQSLK